MNSVLAILENKTIRFARLDSLNDLNEGCCGEYAHLKKYVYVSSWSADERESIPMWSLYGRKNGVPDEGVRIKVPTNLFTFDEYGELKEELPLKRVCNQWNVVTDVNTKEIKLSDNVRNVKRYEKSVFAKRVIGPVKINYLPFWEYKVKYTPFPKLGDIQENSSFYPNRIGYEKVDDWSYENEYRFVMRYPNVQEISGSLNNLKKDIEFTKDQYIDVIFNEKSIPEMEITLAPNFNSDLIDSFKINLEKLGFTKDLQKSALDVRI